MVGDDPDAKEDGIGEALPTGHPIQSQAAFQFLEEVLRLTSLVVPLQDLEGAFLLQGPVAGQGHAWLLPVGRGMFRIASFTARSWSAVMAQ